MSLFEQHLIHQEQVLTEKDRLPHFHSEVQVVKTVRHLPQRKEKQEESRVGKVPKPSHPA